MEETPVAATTRVRDIELRWFEWSPSEGRGPGTEGAGSAPTALFVHATGFHARCWDGVLRLLPELRRLAVDLRGHGGSSKRPPYRWQDFGEDLCELCEDLGIEGGVGVGHSLGGHVIAQVAELRPKTFRALLLVDPVILDPEVYENLPSGFSEGDAHFTAKRRSHFESSAAMYDRFESREPYSRWRREILRAYCEYGLEADPEGGYRLACPPEVEAAIYAGSRRASLMQRLSGIQVPVTVLRARRRDMTSDRIDFSSSPTWPDLARHLARGTDVYLPELSHFIPMEAPEIVADHVRAAC